MAKRQPLSDAVLSGRLPHRIFRPILYAEAFEDCFSIFCFIPFCLDKSLEIFEAYSVPLCRRNGPYEFNVSKPLTLHISSFSHYICA
jgi:hypothetical protein